MTSTQAVPALAAAVGPDDMGTELHALNNALAAALGRIEICEDGLDEIAPLDLDMLRECLHESQRGILRARAHAVQIAALHFVARS